MPDSSHILGIDWGRTDVGLSLADAENRIAFCYGVIKNDKTMVEKLANIIKKENAGSVVIGIPSYINRESVKYEGEVLGEILEKEVGIKVYYQNEMFTTKMAQANLIEKGVKGIKKHDDEEAARIILQDWLDRQK